MGLYGGVFCHGFACCWVCLGDGEQKQKSSREDEVVLVAQESCGRTSEVHEEVASWLGD